MRPGPIGPGNELIAGPLAGMLFASMRPGPIGPGNADAMREDSERTQASMRPGPIGPGNWEGVHHGKDEDDRFNEARPNWAGKFRNRLVSADPDARASMRPGPIGPGNFREWEELTTAATELQ